MESKLKFSVADWTYCNKNADRFSCYKKLAEAGFPILECVQESKWATAQNAGLRVLNTDAPGRDDGINNPALHDELAAGMREVIRKAAANDIAQVILFGGKRIAGMSDEEALENSVKCIRRVAPYAEEAGVMMGIELAHSEESSDQQADNFAYGVKMVRQVNSPFFKIIYCVISRSFMKENVADDLVADLDTVVNIHVSGVDRRNPGPDGGIPYNEIVPRVHRAGFNGTWGLEFYPTGDDIEELKGIRDLFNSYIT